MEHGCGMIYASVPSFLSWWLEDGRVPMVLFLLQRASKGSQDVQEEYMAAALPGGTPALRNSICEHHASAKVSNVPSEPTQAVPVNFLTWRKSALAFARQTLSPTAA